jgi:hypothetical protein
VAGPRRSHSGDVGRLGHTQYRASHIVGFAFGCVLRTADERRGPARFGQCFDGNGRAWLKVTLDARRRKLVPSSSSTIPWLITR